MALTWFTNYWVPFYWPGKFVVTVHDLLHLEAELVPASPPMREQVLLPASAAKRHLSRLTFQKICRSAETIMFDSRFTQREFERRIGRPKHGCTIHLGGDHIAPPGAAASATKEKRLIAVAASKKHKNFPAIVQAWSKVRISSEWILTVVSPGSELRSSVDLERLVGGISRVELHRGLSDQALAELYARSAILLMPSLYEGFGLPLLEGMNAGCLCVSSSAGSLVEIAEGCFVHFVNGRDLEGWIGAIEAACAAFEGKGIDVEPLIEHNRTRAARFTWDKTSSEIAQVIEQALIH